MAVFENHTWGSGHDPKVLGLASIPPSLIKTDMGRFSFGRSDGSEKLVLKYLKEVHQTQLDTLDKDSKQVAAWDIGTSSPTSCAARKRSLEDALREDAAGKLTPANLSRKQLSRGDEAAKSKTLPWYLTGESKSLTQQLSDKIRVLNTLQDSLKPGGEIVIEIPKPEKSATSVDQPASKKKPARSHKLTKDEFDKLKVQIAQLKKEKSTLAAKNASLISIMTANGLRTDHLSDKRRDVVVSTPKSARSEATALSTSTPEIKQLQTQLADRASEVLSLKDQLKALGDQHAGMREKMVRYKTERRFLAKMAKTELSDSE